jgi:hypothetical protein
MTNCQVSENWKSGPLMPHTTTTPAASRKVEARPAASEVLFANHRRILRSWMVLFHDSAFGHQPQCCFGAKVPREEPAYIAGPAAASDSKLRVIAEHVQATSVRMPTSTLELHLLLLGTDGEGFDSSQSPKPAAEFSREASSTSDQVAISGLVFVRHPACGEALFEPGADHASVQPG